MKNYWLKIKEERELRELMKKKLKSMISEGEWHHITVQFDGTSSSVNIDDVQIFDRALNDHEVRDLYRDEIKV